MPPTRIQQIVRQFQENAIKLLLENPRNVGDLLALPDADILKEVDFSRLKLIQTTFVQRDYRHVESDVVLVAPLRRRKGERSTRRVVIYVLIEHQSEPDPLMPLRCIDYVVQIMALVYHVREPSERPGLQRTIEASVQTDEHRQEVVEMRRTIADELKEEGAREGAIKKSQQTLIRLLKRRFGDVPGEVASTIRVTDDPDQLDEWLDLVVTARTLDEIGIEVPA